MTSQLFTNIILPLPLPRPFTYRVSEKMADEIQKGKRVIVQFGKKKYYTGIVYEIHKNEPSGYEIKEITSILDNSPVIDENQFKIWEWISKYYLCTMGEVMKASLPAGFKLESETRISLVPDIEFEGVLTEKELLVIDMIEKKQLVSIKDIEGLIGSRHTPEIVKILLEKKIIAIEEKFTKGYKPKLETYVTISEKYTSEEAINHLFDSLSKAPRQLNLLIAYLSLSGFLNNKKTVELKKSDLLEKSKENDQSLKALVKKGIFHLQKKQTDRIPIPTFDLQPLKELNQAQMNSLQEIRNLFDNKEVVLLHGITSSGKTEIYIHLINEVLKKGGQCLYLLPEIALTSQIINRLRNVFGEKTAVYHSKYSDNEKFTIVLKVQPAWLYLEYVRRCFYHLKT